MAQAVAGVRHEIPARAVQRQMTAGQMPLIVIIEIRAPGDPVGLVILIIAVGRHGVGDQDDLLHALRPHDHLQHVRVDVDPRLVADELRVHIRIIQRIFVTACADGPLRKARRLAGIAVVRLYLHAAAAHPAALRGGRVRMAQREDCVRIRPAHVLHEPFDPRSGRVDRPDARKAAHRVDQRPVFLRPDLPAPEDRVLVAALAAHIRPFHIQAAEVPRPLRNGGLYVFQSLQHLLQRQIAVKGRQDRRLAVREEKVRTCARRGIKVLPDRAVVMDIDQPRRGI